ncbi:unnamed protein product [Gongylonema pulchrum]|uniref:Tnp_zf-ribbon_2 domain-containing protein n=1 Tax=Gongylonema pulchrum TaxID=637853 RepID=A0A183ETS3_9BILA|nr:unnamed protein product [Gongylonema pulchrum]
MDASLFSVVCERNNKAKATQADRITVADNGEQKKCRARFGVVNQDQWCKHCKRKKRCLWYREIVLEF